MTTIIATVKSFEDSIKKLMLCSRPDVFMAVHVHGVELLLLDLFLIGLVLHALQHLISDVFGQDGQ